MEVKNKIVIITGAGSGIGKATAIHFAKYGAIVVVSDIDLESAKKVAEEIVTNGGTSRPIKANVAKFEEVENLINETVEEFGRLDVIVNNAGIGPNLLRTHESSLKDWDRVIAVNQTGVFYCMKLALVQFLKQGAGVVTTRAHARFVVTEFGVAELFGRTLKQRAKSLRDIAHPDHREALDKAIFERFGTSIII